MLSLFTHLTNKKKQKFLANAIVTSVFMGLVRERLNQGKQVFIGYGGGFDPYEGSQSLGGMKKVSTDDKAGHKELNKLLRQKLGTPAELLVIGAANQWIDVSKGNRSHFPTSSFVITGALSDNQIHKEMSNEAKQLAHHCLNSNRYKENDINDKENDKYKVNKERGAYYGIADLNNGVVYGPIGTTRQVYRKNSGRWMNPDQGWIFTPERKIADGSHTAMVGTDDEKYIQTLSGGMSDDNLVVGYCHAMIFMQHICKVSGGGTAYEISMNEQTCKNASCFGCATFMFANGMPPSWMHLGSAESWSPLPERVEDFGYNANFDHDQLKSVAKEMNSEWAIAVARWMKVGVSDISDPYLKQGLEKRTDREIAYLFLDALTIHGTSDLERILETLKKST
jgi:hypothetical protein